MTADQLQRGRDAFDRRSWPEVLDALSAADAQSPLDPADLEILAIAAYMAGDYASFERTMERGHQAWLERRDLTRGVRCAVWVGISLALRGEVGPASGWFARANRLLDGAGECVERGYLLLPTILAAEAAGAYEAAATNAAEAVEVARRFGDADLQALATHAHGLALLAQGRSDDGLPLLDEAMVAVTTGELSPVVTGIVYCGVIAGCHEVAELRRAREWTAALTRWCDEQRGLVSFTGKCLLHRTEILHLRGAWPEALDEARRASGRFLEDENASAAGQALYYEGEVHRLRGEHERAEQAYRAAALQGWEPQPGLALLRLAQGDTAAALGAIRRVVGETTRPARRARLLPAVVEILLAAGEVGEARTACTELRAPEGGEPLLLRAMRHHAEGAVDLAEGDAWAALTRLRAAADAYALLDVPYERARARELLARACDTVGDLDTAALELDVARAALAALGAVADLARIDAHSGAAGPGDSHGLTRRELEVLRLLADGRTNRRIASDLVISERTVARHVSNIFARLGLSSRAAATAFAYEHGLV